MVEEVDTDQVLGVVAATINGEVDGDMMRDHLDHGDTPQVMEGAGAVAGEMEHMVEVERRKEVFEVEEEEEEEPTHTNN